MDAWPAMQKGSRKGHYRTLADGRRVWVKEATTRRTAAAKPPSVYHGLMALRPALAAAAQKVLDEWQPDEEGWDEDFGEGGACDEIARAMTDVLATAGLGLEVQEAGQEGSDHAYLVAYTPDRSQGFVVDIPPRVYEEGGGYSWQKIADAQVDAGDVVIYDVGDDLALMLDDEEGGWGEDDLEMAGPRFRDFLEKARVKGHYRTDPQTGKRTWVKEHETRTRKKAPAQAAPARNPVQAMLGPDPRETLSDEEWTALGGTLDQKYRGRGRPAQKPAAVPRPSAAAQRAFTSYMDAVYKQAHATKMVAESRRVGHKSNEIHFGMMAADAMATAQTRLRELQAKYPDLVSDVMTEAQAILADANASGEHRVWHEMAVRAELPTVPVKLPSGRTIQGLIGGRYNRFAVVHDDQGRYLGEWSWRTLASALTEGRVLQTGAEPGDVPEPRDAGGGQIENAERVLLQRYMSGEEIYRAGLTVGEFLEKSKVKGHYRTTPSGKKVWVPEHETRRPAARKPAPGGGEAAVRSEKDYRAALAERKRQLAAINQRFTQLKDEEARLRGGKAPKSVAARIKRTDRLYAIQQELQALEAESQRASGIAGSSIWGDVLLDEHGDIVPREWVERQVWNEENGEPAARGHFGTLHEMAGVPMEDEGPALTQDEADRRMRRDYELGQAAMNRAMPIARDYLAKARVKGHYRTDANGKQVWVKEHDTKAQAAAPKKKAGGRKKKAAPKTPLAGAAPAPQEVTPAEDYWDTLVTATRAARAAKSGQKVTARDVILTSNATLGGAPIEDGFMVEVPNNLFPALVITRSVWFDLGEKYPPTRENFMGADGPRIPFPENDRPGGALEAMYANSDKFNAAMRDMIAAAYNATLERDDWHYEFRGPLGKMWVTRDEYPQGPIFTILLPEDY